MSGSYWRSVRSERRRFLRGAGLTAAGLVGMTVLGRSGSSKSGSSASNATAPAGARQSTPAGSTAGAAVIPSSSAGPKPNTGAAQATSTADPLAQAVDGSFFRWSASAGFTTLDPRRVTSIYPDLQLPYSGLIRYSDVNNGILAPDIASALPEQPDKATYIFTIRDGVKWHNKPPANGRTLTVDDVVANIKAQTERVDSTGKQEVRYTLYNQLYRFVDKAEAIDATHVKVTLKRPYAPWLAAMAHASNVLLEPQTIAQLIDPTFNSTSAAAAVGTGPYIATEYDPTKRRVFMRNPDYFRKKAGDRVQFADQIIFNTLGNDPNALGAAFQQKQIDSFTYNTPQVLDQVRQATGSGARLAEVPNPNVNACIHYSCINGYFKQGSLLEKATSMAIDRQQVLQLVYAGLGRTTSIVPWAYRDWSLAPDELEKTPGYRSDKTQDLKDARQMWDAGGGGAIDHVDFVYLQGASDGVEEWLPAMMQKNLGVKWVPRGIPATQNLAHIYDPNFHEPIWVGSGAWTLPDPTARFSDFVLEGQPNFCFYHNTKTDALLEQRFNEFDTKKAQEIIKDGQRLVIADGGAGRWILAATLSRTLYWNYVHIVPDSFQYTGLNMQTGWIDQKDPSFASRPA